ncbi:MAG: hypothetical protein K8R41_03350 [Bacteroidales bacterium]|nr:hypothetical protein [Bacteroidales bacterium]
MKHKQRKYLRKAVSLIILTILFSSCDVLQQVTEMETFAKCEFQIKNVSNLQLAGINIQNKNKLSDINFLDAAKITAAFVQGQLPLSLILNISIKNPNPTTASMNKMDWILFIDNIEMTRGTSNQRVQIAANNGVSTLSLQMQADLLEVLSSESAEAITNFGFNLSGNGNRPTRIIIKVKPSVYVGKKMITYPGYITVRNTFTSK